MSLTKKIRFEVFKRDGFKCQYCGQTPPAATLEVDHINPVSKGGDDDINNLITSCFDCNRGKSNIELKRIPNSIQVNKEILEERETQYLEYHKLLAKIDKRINKEVVEIVEIFEKYFTTKTLTPQFINVSLKPFLRQIDAFEVKQAMEKSCAKFYLDRSYYQKGKGWIHADISALKYFCGICWNIIKGKGRINE